ncbi:hypothetical protein DUNSADRAFT_7211 [Dunaliella salina]|uniref:Uncharacterized protein n=1 Tax=Dunaliella salina TaxID=3046 RepID=A0ABQ7GLW6_DUNSA|nr:hypothetical protein DUNSADRAFT_7211 [Dunaliella salina]|eukprot:KAF5835558.1 hypothetical protein DUNSADRAFT_7211 [Dunaliella salina]
MATHVGFHVVCLTNIYLDDKAYVGQAHSVEARTRGRRSCPVERMKNNPRIYGWNAFELIVIQSGIFQQDATRPKSRTLSTVMASFQRTHGQNPLSLDCGTHGSWAMKRRYLLQLCGPGLHHWGGKVTKGAMDSIFNRFQQTLKGSWPMQHRCTKQDIKDMTDMTDIRALAGTKQGIKDMTDMTDIRALAGTKQGIKDIRDT